MSSRELEVLLALCKAAPLIQITKDAESLLDQLAPYMPEAHRQTIKSTSAMLHLPPWETLARELTSAVLTLATNHPTLMQRAFSCVDETIQALSKSADEVAWLRSHSDEAADQHQGEHALRSIQMRYSLSFNVLARFCPKSSWSLWRALCPLCATLVPVIDL
jgi:phosphatidylinositol 4-kinase